MAQNRLTSLPEFSQDYDTEASLGNVSGRAVIHKFGRNDLVGTAYVPVTIGGIFRVPQVAAATTLRVKAGNANDTAAGSGAREITLIGIDETGAQVEEAIATNGASSGPDSVTTFIRLPRAYVSASGTYATHLVGSHVASVVIENSAGTEDWLTIDVTDFPRGQSEVGVYTVPVGKRGQLNSIFVSVDSNTSASLILYKRADILQTSPPYSGIRQVLEFTGVSGEEFLKPKVPISLGLYSSGIDIGFMAKTGGGTAAVNVDFEIETIDV